MTMTRHLYHLAALWLLGVGAICTQADPVVSSTRGVNDPTSPEATPHWAFRPPTRPSPPPVAHSRWVRNPIDAFIARDHERLGLKPQPEARREILYRRLYFDLLGVPPTSQEIDALELDRSDKWYERLADRLLQDPRYGERWGRHWMDIWRYSDAWGLGDQLRNSQKHIWHWRDWIVESLNADLPYDEMLRQMLAADELYPEDLQKLRATGFLARGYFLFNRNQWMDEVVEHVSKGFLGLTVNCAKCHDHKYDPIAQTDFYRMRALFEPYHARLDVLPGETDLTRDGIPRVFDTAIDIPTYRFIRGNENTPDKSAKMTPGVPEFLAVRFPEIHPLTLPVSVVQPERRPWIFEGYQSQAKLRREAAEARLHVILSKPATNVPTSEAKLEHDIAEAAAQLARLESESVERRIEATRAQWSQQDAGASCLDCERQAKERTQTAALAERKVAEAQANHALLQAQLKLTQAPTNKNESLLKELQTAKEALSRAQAALSTSPATNASFTRFIGAQWTPTRFLSSTADDPAVAFSTQSTGRRKALAEWMTDPRHPLTARVAVNHIWGRHMGTPLVGTVFDFGKKGAAPTHPELLDWLASELVNSGWSMKQLHRTIVTSSTYRMSSSSAGGEADAAKDPENHFWWRRNPIRLESQAVRDALLTHAGQLDLTRGGPPVPPQQQETSKRRSLYFAHSNNDRNLFLDTFDNAGVKECYRRNESIVPQQALALTNSRLVLDAATDITKQLSLLRSGDVRSQTDAGFIRLSFAVMLGMKPSDAEIAASVEALKRWRETESSGVGAGSVEERARTQLIWALINHNDFVTLR